MRPASEGVASRRGWAANAWRLVLAGAAAAPVLGWLAWSFVARDADGCPRFPTAWADGCRSDLALDRYPNDPTLAREMIRRLSSSVARDSAWWFVATRIDNCPQYCNRLTGGEPHNDCLRFVEYRALFKGPGCWALPAGEAPLGRQSRVY